MRYLDGKTSHNKDVIERTGCHTESIRNELKLSAGTQFAVLGKGDVVVLKHIKPPRLEEFAKIRAEVRKQARKAGMTKSAVSAAVRKVRKRK